MTKIACRRTYIGSYNATTEVLPVSDKALALAPVQIGPFYNKMPVS